jgi:hypothetical protein
MTSPEQGFVEMGERTGVIDNIFGRAYLGNHAFAGGLVLDSLKAFTYTKVSEADRLTRNSFCM